MLWDTIVALVAVALVVIVFWKLPDDDDAWEELQAEGKEAEAEAKAGDPAETVDEPPPFGAEGADPAETADEPPPTEASEEPGSSVDAESAPEEAAPEREQTEDKA